ncbi:MAG: methyltransferase domain-containing protein [Candidatus Promineifilaceae bacterium]|nr:methyltransferase domain-containing protein [Candidatus Promineifilaceae bacterium]
MVPVEVQITSGRLVCPLSHQSLLIDGEALRTPDGAHVYPYRDGVPILLPEAQMENYLAEESGKMAREYAREYAAADAAVSDRRAFLTRPLVALRRRARYLAAEDYRSAACRTAFEAAIGAQPEEALCVAVGGGPTHLHPKLVNLNIAPFANVHVVGDAYQLPYANDAVDAVHCEAVLEHLELPDVAVAEMFRVLRPGGQLYAATPFLQPFHAYPNHFQNFTEVGHRRLFERAGFAIVDSGGCVGPTYAVSALVYRYIVNYVRVPLLRELLAGAAGAGALLLRPLDRRINRREDAHQVASTVFTHAVKR